MMCLLRVVLPLSCVSCALALGATARLRKYGDNNVPSSGEIRWSLPRGTWNLDSQAVGTTEVLSPAEMEEQEEVVSEESEALPSATFDLMDLPAQPAKRPAAATASSKVSRGGASLISKESPLDPGWRDLIVISGAPAPAVADSPAGAGSASGAPAPALATPLGKVKIPVGKIPDAKEGLSDAKEDAKEGAKALKDGKIPDAVKNAKAPEIKIKDPLKQKEASTPPPPVVKKNMTAEEKAQIAEEALAKQTAAQDPTTMYNNKFKCNPPCHEGRGVCNDNVCFCRHPWSGSTCNHKITAAGYRFSYIYVVAGAVVSTVLGVLLSHIIFSFIREAIEQRTASMGEELVKSESWMPSDTGTSKKKARS